MAYAVLVVENRREVACAAAAPWRANGGQQRRASWSAPLDQPAAKSAPLKQPAAKSAPLEQEEEHDEEQQAKSEEHDEEQ